MEQFINTLKHIYDLTSKSILIWVIFNVAISLIPIIASVFFSSSNPTNKIREIYLKGEFLLILSAIGAGALGELFNSGKLSNMHVILGGLNFITLLFCSFGYFIVKSSYNTNVGQNQYDILRSRTNGLIWFGLASSLGCIMISKVGS